MNNKDCNLVANAIFEYEHDHHYRNVRWREFLKEKELDASCYMAIYQNIVIRELVDKVGNYISSIIKMNNIDDDETRTCISCIISLYNNYNIKISWKGSGFTVGWNDGRWEVSVYKDDYIILNDYELEKGMVMDRIVYLVRQYCWKI